MKERITITLEKGVISYVDHEIDGNIIKNRSHAIELILKKHFESNAINTAVILAGGEKSGKIFENSKKENAIIHNLLWLKDKGIKKIYVCAGKNNFKIKSLIKDKDLAKGIEFINEDTPMGTAGVLKLINGINKAFIVCNGDEIKEVNIEEMNRFHKKNNALATIALRTTSTPSKYGFVRLEGNKILEFIEKPEKKGASLVSAGFYILEPEVLNLISDGKSFLERSIFPRIASENKLYGYYFSGKWLKI